MEGEEVVVRESTGSDLASVLALLKQAKSTVGFLRDQAVEERMLKGTLLVADADGIVGYVLYDIVSGTIAIRQLVVDQAARKLGTGRLLIEAVVARHEESTRGMRLWCRRDYAANDFWHRLGFAPRNERSGKSEGRILTLWWRGFGQPDLFSVARDLDERPIAALDTNILIRGSDGDLEVVEDLLSDWVRAEVAFEVVDHSLVEINQHDDLVVRRRHIEYASSFDELRYEADLAVALFEAVSELLGTGASPHIEDLRIAARAAAGGATWIVTEDDSFRRSCRKALLDVADLEVVSISEMLLVADQIARHETYSGQLLQGTEIEVREVGVGDLDEIARSFVNPQAGEGFKSWRKRLSELVSKVDDVELLPFVDGEGLVAVAALRRGDVMEVPVCRVRRGAGEPTLARQLLGWLRYRCAQRGFSAVVITDPNPGTWIERHYSAEGFFLAPRPTAVPISCSLTIQEVVDRLMFEPFTTPEWGARSDELLALSAAPATAHSIERAFHPVVITGCGLPTIRMPINPRFAAELFDYVLSDAQLFRRDRALALRREHVYFRSPTSAALLRAPARLLWQVTGDQARGGRSLRAKSLLDEMVIGDVDQLVSRFSHLGVLDRDQIQAMASDGKVMALRFSHTWVFPTPITLAQYREVMRRLEPGKGLAHAGPQPVSEHVFVELARLAG
ncbi:GNAT family N-acetyltransferase [Ilumatobacter sp.]|uniref:GNAT family N-acetyltransferase n=1 Tax=Ilumatobacter sp. TaxID=1967498 RepID=UPI003B519622